MQTTIISLGQFELSSSILKIIEPFIKEENRAEEESIILNIKNGIWHAQLSMIENLGNANITLFHEKFNIKDNDMQFVSEGYVQASNGYVACVDYKQYNKLKEVEKFNEELSLCMEELDATVFSMGVASKTGLTGGSYQLKTIVDKDKVIAVQLVFIETESTETPTQEELEEMIA